MALSTSVKYFRADMPGAPQLKGNDPYAVRRILKMCLVEGTGEITASGGNVSNGVCTINVDPENTFPKYATILVDGVSNKTSVNGEQRVISNTPGQISFETGESNGALTTNGYISIRCAPAGWEIPFTETADEIVFRSTDPSSDKYYLRITANNYQGVYAQGFWDMHDTESGITPFPPVWDIANDLNGSGYPWPKSYSNDTIERMYILLADSRCFYFIVYPRADKASVNQLPTGVFFGDYINELPVSLSNRNSTAITGHNKFVGMVNTSSTIFGYNQFRNRENSYLAKDSSIGMPKRSCQITYSGADGGTLSLNAGSPVPIWKHGKYPITPFHIADNDNVIYGRMPGMYFGAIKAGGILINMSVYNDEDNGDRPYLITYNYVSGSLSSNPHTGSSSGLLFDLLGPWE